MDNSYGNAVPVGGGIISSVGFYLLNIDWSRFVENLVPTLITAGLVAVVGGVSGLMGRDVYKFLKSIFIKSKTKKDG